MVPRSTAGRLLSVALPLLAGLQLLAEQRAAWNGATLPTFSPWWLVAGALVTLGLVPRARKGSGAMSPRSVVVLAGLLSAGLGVRSARRHALRTPGFVATMHVLENDAWVPRETIALPSLGFDSRRELARATGLRRDTKLGFDGVLHAPEAGTYTLVLRCDDRCLVAIDDENVADSEQEAEVLFPLTRGRHRIAFEYVQRDGPAFADIRWRRPATFAFLPMDYYLGDAGYVPDPVPALVAFALSLIWWLAFFLLCILAAESRGSFREELDGLVRQARRAFSRARAPTRRWGTRLAVCTFLLGTVLLCWRLLDGRVRVSALRGDWSAVVEGAQLAGRGEALGAGSRAFVHFHELDGKPGSLELKLRSMSNEPIVVAAWLDGARAEPRSLGSEGEIVRFPFAKGAKAIDVGLEVVSEPPAPGALYRIEEIRLIRGISFVYSGLALLVLVASSAVVVVSARRASVSAAVIDGLLAALVGTWFLVLCLDPSRLHQIANTLRYDLRVACLAVVWMRAFTAAPSRARAWASVVATVLLLYLPALRYGFVTDDFLFGRAMTWRQTWSTSFGHWDPFGVANDHYRPVIALSLALDYGLWGAKTEGWHATNLIVHALNGVLAVGLLERLGLGRKAALLGGLAWCAHPMGATAASWANERTDEILIVFYLACLIFLVAPRFGRWQIAGVLATGALALGSKELAVTIPVVAGLVVWLSRDLDARRLRQTAVAALAVMVALYVGLWLFLFPEKAAGATGLALSSASIESWPRHPAAFLYSSVFAPGDYGFWQALQFGADRSATYIFVGPFLWGLAFTWLRYRREENALRAARLGGAWPAITVLPLLGLSGGIDLFRLGWLTAFGFALTWAALLSAPARRVTPRARTVCGLATAALAVWFATASMASSQAWSPDGFMARLGARWTASTVWRSRISPEMRALYDEQMERESHARAWVRRQKRQRP